MKTLKYEEVLRNEHRDLTRGPRLDSLVPGKVYNQKRMHSALDDLPPVECEAQLKAQNMGATAPQLVALVFEE